MSRERSGPRGAPAGTAGRTSPTRGGQHGVGREADDRGAERHAQARRSDRPQQDIASASARRRYVSPVIPSSSASAHASPRGSRATPATDRPAGRTSRGAPASGRPRPGSSGGCASSPCSRGLYYNGHAKSMGKRELLLISGFAVIGLLVYQLTMPATADTGGGFSAWWAKVRSHVGQNWVEQHYERKDEVEGAGRHPHGGRAAGPRLGDDPRRGARHPRRRPLGRRLRRRRGDGQGAGEADHGRRHHGRAAHEAGPDPAEAGRTARRPRVQLTLRVPARLGIELRLGGGELDVTNVGSLQVVKASGRIRIASIAGAVTGELGPGEIEIDHAGIGGHRDPQQPGPHRRRRRLVRGRGEARRLPRPRHRRRGASGGEGRRSRARGSRRAAPPHRLRRRGPRPRRARPHHGGDASAPRSS